MKEPKKSDKKGERKMAVLTAKCDKAFVVSVEQSKSFLEHKTGNDKNKEMLSKITSKIEDNNGKA